MGFRIRRPGHIVIRCSDVHRSRDFYSKVVGLNIYGNGNRDMYFLSADFDRNHHMVLIRPAIGGAPKPDGDNQIGLAAASFELTSFYALKALHGRLKAYGARIARTEDRGAVKSIFVYDPDGNMFEFYSRDPAAKGDLAAYTQVLGTLDKVLGDPSMAEA